MIASGEKIPKNIMPKIIGLVTFPREYPINIQERLKGLKNSGLINVNDKIKMAKKVKKAVSYGLPSQNK